MNGPDPSRLEREAGQRSNGFGQRFGDLAGLGRRGDRLESLPGQGLVEMLRERSRLCSQERPFVLSDLHLSAFSTCSDSLSCCPLPLEPINAWSSCSNPPV